MHYMVCFCINNPTSTFNLKTSKRRHKLDITEIDIAEKEKQLSRQKK